MIDSRELAKQVADLFNTATSVGNSYQVIMETRLAWLTEEKGEHVRYYHEPKASPLRKLKVFILSLLPFESLL